MLRIKAEAGILLRPLVVGESQQAGLFSLAALNEIHRRRANGISSRGDLPLMAPPLLIVQCQGLQGQAAKQQQRGGCQRQRQGKPVVGLSWRSGGKFQNHRGIAMLLSVPR